MRNIPALTRREMNSVFLSPLAYIILTLFLLFSGFFFFMYALQTQQANMNGVFSVVAFLILVATPVITMRLLSEEFRSGTIEPLMTAPVTDGEVIVAKWLGAYIFFLFMLAPTLIYLLILAALGKPDYGPIISNYLCLILMAGEFIALGLFCSALTANQIVAAVMSLVMLIIVWVIGAVGTQFPAPLDALFAYVGTSDHIRSFATGRLAFRDVFYFVSLTVFWLFLSVRALESRRWR